MSTTPPSSPPRPSLLTRAIRDASCSPPSKPFPAPASATPPPFSWAAKLKSATALPASPPQDDDPSTASSSLRSSKDWPTLAASLTAKASPHPPSWTHAAGGAARLRDANLAAAAPFGASPNGRPTLEEFAAAHLMRIASPAREPAVPLTPALRDEHVPPEASEDPADEGCGEGVVGEWEDEEEDAGPGPSAPSPVGPSNPWSRPLPFAAPASSTATASPPRAAEPASASSAPVATPEAILTIQPSASEGALALVAAAAAEREEATRFFLETAGAVDDEEAGDLTCAICLEAYEFENSATIKGCEHTFCATCIVKWSLHRQACPCCKKSFSHLITYRMLDGALSDYPQEEPLCLLQRAKWLEGAVDAHMSTARPHILSADDAPSGAHAHLDDALGYEDDQWDEDAEDYYTGGGSRRTAVLANRRFGSGGFIHAGRAFARPIVNANTPGKGPGKKGKGKPKGGGSTGESGGAGPSSESGKVGVDQDTAAFLDAREGR